MLFLLLAAGKLLLLLLGASGSGALTGRATAVEAPVQRTREEALAALEELASSASAYQKIVERSDAYPDAVLEALANNPEMLEFASAYPDSDGTVTGGLTREETRDDYPLFLQWDSRWGYASYGSSCIGISGCGPTCLSMTVYALTRDESATPDRLADYAWRQGYYVEGTGTAWSLMTDGAADFGITGTELALDEQLMKRELDAGHPIICAMGPGDFTTAGHFIMLYGYDDSGFFVNDPNCRSRSGRAWSYDDLSGQIKNLWYFQ